MHTDDFDFALPPELIAQGPLAERDASRLLHVRRPTGQVQHRLFRELPSLLREGDLLVFNDSRVIPARLIGKKRGTGGRAELLLVRPATDVQTSAALEANAAGTVWTCLGQSSKGFRPGMELDFDAGLTATVLEAPGGGEYRVKFTSPMATLEEAIARAGKLPLPPYITREVELSDAERYQTIYARQKGSVAAPTAGLHFTQETFAELKQRGVQHCFVSLEVGPGTFMPVREGPISEHRMHEERASISAQTAELILTAKREKRRVIAVGTTVVRTLETWATTAPGLPERSRGGSGASANSESSRRPSTPLGQNGGSPQVSGLPGAAFSTAIFITPGFQFQIVDALITNFHLPKSTLVMLVSAFLGREQTLAAYAEAIHEKYRFFSYGDAMFID